MSDSNEYDGLVIPVAMQSKEALEFLGFNSETASRLMDNWTRYGDSDRTFQDLVFGYLDEEFPSASTDWYASMERIGLSKERQDGIMDPNFNDVRGTASLSYWVTEFVYEDFILLLDLNDRIDKNLGFIKNGLPQLRGGAHDRSDYHLTQAGHTTLYRATSVSRLARVSRNGTLDLSSMLCAKLPVSDFCQDGYAYYWSKQHRVAERFAQYTARNVKIPGDVAILRMLCPYHHLEGPTVWTMDYGDDWRKLVWHSRNDKIYPADIQTKWDAAKVIIGPVSIDHNDAFQAMKGWEGVTNYNVLTVGSERQTIGTQHAWIGRGSMADLNSVVKDKLDLFKSQNGWTRRNLEIKYVQSPEQWVTDRLARNE